ncbi:MAG: hypothetical protein OEN01_01090 [Candidatus Krumholzibacteria bacterium]|nr:hypothetical protein [Candidatus Krumholzibacteria bacterium]
MKKERDDEKAVEEEPAPAVKPPGTETPRPKPNHNYPPKPRR